MKDWRVVRASTSNKQLVNELSSELYDVTAGHVVEGHVIAADLHVGRPVKLQTVADSWRSIWLNRYDVPHKQVRDVSQLLPRKYCDEYVCLSVCLSTRITRKPSTWPYFAKLFVHACCLWACFVSFLTALRYVMYFTSCYVDDVRFLYHGANGQNQA